MYYSGYFRNTDTSTDEAGQLFKVVIITNFKEQEYNYGGELMLSDSPFIVNYENEDGNIFKPYKCSTATVGILQKEYNFDFCNTSGNNVLVMLLRFKNGRKEDEVLDSELNSSYDKQLQIDNICYSLEWVGYATPNTYSQSFEDFYDEFELEAQDALSTLQYFPYEQRSIQNTYLSFIEIIKRFCRKLRAYKNIYVTDTLRLPTTDDGDILQFCYIDQRNFYDEDEKAKTDLEVLEQVCMFLNLSIIPYGDSLYIVDYNGLKNGYNSFYHYKYNLDNYYLIPQLVAVDITTYFLQDDKVTFEDSHDIKESDFSSTGTKLTLLSTYNKLSVKDSLYSFDSISANFEDTSRWEVSGSEDGVGRYDDCNVIVESGGKYVSEYFTDGNNQEHQNMREWVEGGFTPVKRPDNDNSLTVIGNTRKDHQKVFIKYLNFAPSKSIFNNSELTTYWYNKEYKDSNGIWHTGALKQEINRDKDYCYNTMRNYCGAQFVAYAVEKVEANTKDYMPKKLELKPAILISTPTSFSWNEWLNQMTNPNISETYKDLIKPYFKIKSKSVCIGSGDYIVISWKQKSYKEDDCLPINVDSTDNVDLGTCQHIGVSLNGHDYYADYLPGTFHQPYYFDTDGKKAFGTDLVIAEADKQAWYNFKDKIGVDSGIVLKARLNETENNVEVGDIEVTFYRPFGGSKNIPVKCTLIEDFKIEVVTKSDINSLNASNDDTDTEYSNVISEEAVEEKSSIDLDISTWDNKQPNYSSVVYSETLNDVGNNMNFDNKCRLRHIYNRATGEVLRAEEHIINNNITQYSSPTVNLNLNLHIKPLPYSTFTYHYFNDKLFIVDGSEFDYANNSYNINLIEKK